MAATAAQNQGVPRPVSEAIRQPVYVFEGYRLDAQRRVLHAADGRPIPLTPRLFDTLLYFVERAGQLLTKEQLMDALWPRVVVEEHNLNKTVSELRRVLGEKPGQHKFIVTKPGHGYRFVASVSLESSADASSATRHPGPEAGVTAVPRQVSAARRRWQIAALSAGALAIVFAVVGFFRPATDPVLRTTPWAAEKRGQWFPVWSPDGTEIAWATLSNATEPAELNIRGLNEPVSRPIARLPQKIPAITQWTSDGKIFFFEREGLYSISPVGALPELAVPIDYLRLGLTVPIRAAHLTRNGSTLAMLARGEDGAPAIWTATPPTATRERYEPAPFAASAYQNSPFLRFSPDGSQLLFIWYAAGRGEEAWLLPFPPDANNPPRRVLEDLPLAVGNAEFSWFPDNRHIAISTGPDQLGTLYVADTRSGKFRLLADELTGQKSVPVVSPDGSKLLFRDLAPDSDIVTLDLLTGGVTDLIATGRSEAMPSWANEANALAYITNRSGDWEIWLQQPPQAERPLITQRDFDRETLYLIAPTLSPDGARLIFDRVEAERPGARLWMSAVAGGRPELLTNDEEVEELAGSWSPDGIWYAYLAAAPGGGPRMLKKVKATGQATPETLLEGLATPGSPAPIWSSDGNWILVPNSGMTLVSADGKTKRDLRIENSACTFADDEPLLYCVRDTMPSPEHPLVKLDLHGNVLDTVVTLPRALMPSSPFGPGLRLSLTPDRSRVTYSVERTTQSLFLMEGLDTVELP
jgi:DNA-binding winged helix-turn-helix (wHTH) protein/Tol biopolymer transport system component